MLYRLLVEQLQGALFTVSQRSFCSSCCGTRSVFVSLVCVSVLVFGAEKQRVVFALVVTFGGPFEGVPHQPPFLMRLLSPITEPWPLPRCRPPPLPLSPYLRSHPPVLGEGKLCKIGKSLLRKARMPS